MPRDLLFEIGCEEIPAGFLSRALDELPKILTAVLAAERIATGSIRVMGTPRRLIAFVRDVADSQTELTQELVGPPEAAAYDKQGAPSAALKGFVSKNGVELDKVVIREVAGKKGRYVTCQKVIAAVATQQVLPEMLARVIAQIPWKKSMRWGHGEISFVRPIHWILAVLGSDVVPVEFAGVRSDRKSRGHRFLAPDVFAVENADVNAFEKNLRGRFVMADPVKRKTAVMAELARVEAEMNAVIASPNAATLRVRLDDDLASEVTNLVEYPLAVTGSFAESFLQVPEEVVVSAMRAHQRYFAVERTDGTLANRFVTIAGTVPASVDVVRDGNERVLAARLSDAAFFFGEDRKKTPAEWNQKLSNVVFAKGLGSQQDRVVRITELATYIASVQKIHAEAVNTAASLCKFDLVTHVVGEFPDLQGTMGGYYARHAGESADVVAAISEHYWPRGQKDSCPKTPIGACIALADRVDSLVGGFAAGLAPTGSADPFGLRRAALGMLRILLDRNWTIGLPGLIDVAAKALQKTLTVTPAVQKEVSNFVATRLRGYMVDVLEFPADCVDAAMAIGISSVPDAKARAEALAQWQREPDFLATAAAFKRVANILKEQTVSAPKLALLTEPAEQKLLSVAEKVAADCQGFVADRKWSQALTSLRELKVPVDNFFESVMVLADDPDLRMARLGVLSIISNAFSNIADFRQISV